MVKGSVDSINHTLTLGGPVVPGQRTTIRANVKMASVPNAPIRHDLPDRVDSSLLLGDPNDEKKMNASDYNRLTDVLQQQYPFDVNLHDINRDGNITNVDRNRLQELLQGTDTTQAWADYTLPERP